MKRVIPLLIVIALLSSCASILETERLTVTPHAELELPEPNPETPEASNRAELRTALYGIFRRGQTRGSINIFEYDGDLEAELGEIRDDIILRDAVAAYALSDMSVSVTPIVSFFEVHVEFAYRRTREQIDGITNASTLRYLRSELAEMMGDYRPDAAIRTTIPNITDTDVLQYLTEIYYENPLDIVMLPIVTATIYPENPSDGAERLIELTFGYSQPTAVLQRFGGWLRSAAGDVAAAASGSNDAEILLSLCEGLADLAEYDAAASELSEYPTQSLSATAYGALLGGSAIGEGYAMAYKALCDELSLPCIVVLGTRDGLPHAWNIASYDGAYYHIDAALCDTDGIGAGFFKSDTEMSDNYEWDREKYPVCNGTERVNL
ncbi:MAG: hypothetical protein LBN00_10815 [Oscillospiraceae bacterium]|jgi:hypothetical protein|nr:hypothetical protein [Oscillospiraceae bacterium]